VSDQDFNFNPPPPRREAKKVFEPPPWEKEQFEELARRKEAERIAAEALAAAAAQQQIPAQPVQPAASQEAYPQEAQPVAPQQAASAAPVAQPPMVERAQGAGEGEAAKEDPRIEAMMLGLRNEEPSFGEDVWKISVGAGAVLAAIGAVFVVWGIVALAATRGAGFAASFGGVVLTVFGSCSPASVCGWSLELCDSEECSSVRRERDDRYKRHDDAAD